MDFIIREAKQSDAAALSALYVQFWKPHSWLDPLLRFKKIPSLRRFRPFVMKDLRKRDRQIYVADIDGKVVGFIEVLLCANDEQFKVKEYAYINSCAVDRRHRGKGIARKLLREAIRFSRTHGVKYLKLNVYNSNKAAFNAWHKLGFKPQSTNMIRKI